jgi:hypothetical protein
MLWPGVTAGGVVAAGVSPCAGAAADGAVEPALGDGVPRIVTTSPLATEPERVIVAPVVVVAKLICSPAFVPAAVFALALQLIDVPEG